jgi:hypothetical protein
MVVLSSWWCAAAFAALSCGGKSTRESAGALAPDAGATPDLVCGLPRDPGSCDAYVPSYYHDASARLCLPFVYGGCEGNGNRFASLADCRAACESPSDIDHCTQNSECMLTPSSCCSCNAVTTNDVLALRVDAFATFSGARCATVDCACGGTQAISPYLVATCQAGLCTALDLRATAATACKDDSQCALRAGNQCCSACNAGDSDWIGVSDGSVLESLVCDTPRSLCGHCLPIPPVGFYAFCEQGRCNAQSAVLPL